MRASPLTVHALSRRLLLLVLLAMALVASPRAQSRLLVDAPGTWKAWKFTASQSARTSQGTSADIKAFEAQLLALNAILRRAPGVATPLGFSVETWGYLGGTRTAGPAPPVAGGLDFGAFPIFEYERNGKTIREDTGETALLLFLVNDLQTNVIAGDRVPDWISANADAFLQPPARGEVAGFPRYGDLLVIKRNPRSIWAPVSLEAAIGLLVTSLTRDLDESRAVLGRIEASLADWQNPAKRAERFQGYTVAAAALPDGAKFLADMQDVEQTVMADLQAQLSPQGGPMKESLDLERARADASAWLQGLSAADRVAQACYDKAGATARERFHAGVDDQCVPVVRPNGAFFDRALPRSVPQVLVIPQVSRCFDDQPETVSTPAGCPANRQLLSTWDTQAVLEWLK